MMMNVYEQHQYQSMSSGCVSCIVRTIFQLKLHTFEYVHYCERWARAEQSARIRAESCKPNTIPLASLISISGISETNFMIYANLFVAFIQT